MKTITRTINSEYVSRMLTAYEIPNTPGHILDPEVLKEGGYLLLPRAARNHKGELINRVLIPPQNPDIVNDRVVLTDIQLAFERLLMVIQTYLITLEPEWLPIVDEYVLRYYNAMADTLLGKGGMLDEYIFSFRCKRSARGVVALCPDIDPDQLAIPRDDYERIAEWWGGEPWAVLFRHPVLHDQSFRKLHLVAWDNPAIGVHPAYTRGMGMDFDGDWAYVLVGDPRIDIEEDFEGVEWDHEMLINGGPEIDWADPTADTEIRTAAPDFSLGPIDILKPGSETMEKLGRCAKLKLDEIEIWSSGRTIEECAAEDLVVATGICIQKTGIGRIGNFGKMLFLLAGMNRQLMKSFGHVVEVASQELFDSKHELSDNFQVMLDMLDGRVNSDIAIGSLILAGVLDTVMVQPFAEFMNKIGKRRIRDLVEEGCPAFAATNTSSVKRMGGLPGLGKKTEVINKLVMKPGFNEIVNELSEGIRDGRHYLSETVEESAKSYADARLRRRRRRDLVGQRSGSTEINHAESQGDASRS